MLILDQKTCRGSQVSGHTFFGKLIDYNFHAATRNQVINIERLIQNHLTPKEFLASIGEEKVIEISIEVHFSKFEENAADPLFGTLAIQVELKIFAFHAASQFYKLLPTSGNLFRKAAELLL